MEADAHRKRPGTDRKCSGELTARPQSRVCMCEYIQKLQRDVKERREMYLINIR